MIKSQRVSLPRESHYLFANIATVMVGVGNILLLTNILTVAEMGQYAIYISFVYFAVMIGASWINETYVRKAKQEMLEKHLSEPVQAQSVRVVFFLIGMGLVSIFYGLFRGSIAEFIGLSADTVFWMLVICCLQSVLIWQQAYFRVKQSVLKAAYLVAIQRILFAGILTVMLLFEFGDVYFVIGALLLSKFAVFLMLLSSFRISFDGLSALDISVIKKYMVHSYPFFIGGICLYTVNYVDIAILNVHFDSEIVGIYNVMYSGFNALVLLLMSINSMFLNRIVEFKKNTGGDWPVWYISVVAKLFLGYLCFIGVGLFLVEGVTWILLGEDYWSGANSIKILLIASIFYLITAAAMPVFTAYDVTKYFLFVSAARALVNVVADLILIPKYGMEGAALGTLVSFVVAACIALYCLFSIKRRALG